MEGVASYHKHKTREGLDSWAMVLKRRTGFGVPPTRCSLLFFSFYNFWKRAKKKESIRREKEKKEKKLIWFTNDFFWLMMSSEKILIVWFFLDITFGKE